MKVRAILFDFDHTLVDSPLDFGAMRRGVLEVLAAAGAPIPDDADRRLILELLRASVEGLEGAHAAATERRALAHIARVERQAAEVAEPIAGVAESLAALRREGRRVAVITRNGREQVEAVLARRPLEHDALLAREDTIAVKPDPEHARAALAQLGATAAEAVLVGDFAADMACAVAAGIVPIGVLTGRQDAAALREAGAQWVLPSAADLPAFLAERGW